ncbi:gustatory receptor for bitter taste 66a-like [Tenebrio molitor]|uniref:gustatory receptor for bitter taste 66a-like n=1 Tax=Tenebrio molitor TaxID=7067 RepID=UPI0036248F13
MVDTLWASRTGELLHKIDTEDTDIVDEIEMFSLQIANHNVEFNAAGFFPINYALIFSIIGGVTTYIIILIKMATTKAINIYQAMTLTKDSHGMAYQGMWQHSQCPGL